jgi:trimethylamine:corrinoid methyltransferase-like protein
MYLATYECVDNTKRIATRMRLLSGLALIVGSAAWLAILLVTGFSVIALSAGLLTAVYLLGGADNSAR